MRKFSLIAAALLMGFAVHTAFAADDAPVAGDDAVVVAPVYADGFCRCGQGWGGRPMMRQGWGGHMRGTPMMRHHGWRNWNDNDNDNNGEDSWRGRRFGHGMGWRNNRDGNDDRGARFGGRQPGMGMGVNRSAIMDALNLTDDQRKQMIDIATENFRERLTLRWQMEKAQNTIEEQEDAESPDYNAIVAANEALGSARGKLDVARRQVMDKFAAVLTDEQRDIAAQFLEDDADVDADAEEAAE